MDGRYTSVEARKALEAEAARRFHRARASDNEQQWEDVYRWVAEHPAHGAAFAKAEASWEISERLREVPHMLGCDPTSLGALSDADDDLDDEVDDDAKDAAFRPFRRLPFSRHMMVGLVAAFFIGIICTVAIQFESAVDRYRTAIGEEKVVHLADGSVVHLNTGTSIEVALRDDRRLIRLLQGEARFDVAHDRKRPFLVTAGSTTVRAVGTAFNVRLRSELTELTMIEGIVAVSDGRSFTRRVLAGQAAAIRGGAVAITPVQPNVVNQRMAWQDGHIEFEGDTLAQAVEEFNRYRTVPLVIGDPAIAGLRIGGTFRNDGSEDFVAALELTLGVKAVAGDDSVLLVAAK
ncbi:FecR domain-containing protein [Sphingobium sp. H39-3-25]|uniref:FecR family protein n=1 Tax=Sphingobium arseniciresistens TaxID=3030834 RepID=UPI0023B9B508|nr:FecR domain-containing protein [Sphingobium arseniciresistens]